MTRLPPFCLEWRFFSPGKQVAEMKPGMQFQVGEKVIHKRYGLGEVIGLDEKEFSGQLTSCYVVRVRDLTIWVPAVADEQSSLRAPTPREAYENIFDILRSDGEPLPNDRFQRKTILSENMKEGSLEGFCRVVRDLTWWGSTKKLNVDDRSVLERAQSFVVNEWMLSFSISQTQAQKELNHLLRV
jgi:CarD family transcriptional regulator